MRRKTTSMQNGPIDALCTAVMPKVINWRRDIHEHPELSNREFRTAALVAGHLEGLGLEVRTKIAHTGVVGLLIGAEDGPLIALRADMDALPVEEETGLGFASTVRGEHEGRDVGVMHACGHDAHVAILMGVAETLVGIRDDLRGSVMFIFQPAEEGAPEGEEGGAELLLEEGLFDERVPDAVLGLHVTSAYETGTINVTPGPMMASVDTFRITVRGKQTHGAYPWRGIDPIVISAQIIMALQTIPSRQINSLVSPAIVTVGSIHGGVRENIIPDEVELIGTLRALDAEVRTELRERVRRTAESIAASAGATAEVRIRRGYPIVDNDADLLDRLMPAFERVAGEGNVSRIRPVLGAEDFSFFQEKAPGVYFFIGVRPKDVAFENAAPNHSPKFFVDEEGLGTGVRALVHSTLDLMG